MKEKKDKKVSEIGIADGSGTSFWAVASGAVRDPFIIAAVVVGGWWFGPFRALKKQPSAAVETANLSQSQTSGQAKTDRNASETLGLSEKQRATVKVEPVSEHVFVIEKGAVGSIDFNEDLSVQVFTVYQGKIIQLFGKIGDDVKKGQTLFTIDSPDLVQAESTLIAAAGYWS